MPIPSLTDGIKNAFPRVGVLRKGAPKPNEKQPGKDLKWFRFVTDDEAAAATFAEAFGDNPARINVMLPFATVDENFEAWMEEWGAGSLKHRCDGEVCVIWQDDNGEYKRTPKPCPGNCKPTGRLMVIIPELRRLAYVQVLTTSKHDIIELTANLRAAEDTAHMMRQDLRGIPFVLTRVPREISTPPRGNGNKRIRAEKWLLHIEPAPHWVSMQIEAAQRMAMPMIEAPGDIPYPNGDDDAEPITVELVEDETPPTSHIDESLIDKEELERAKQHFFSYIIKKIPYYNNNDTIAKTLRELGYDRYTVNTEEEMFTALEKHAQVAANKEAA